MLYETFPVSGFRFQDGCKEKIFEIVYVEGKFLNLIGCGEFKNRGQSIYNFTNRNYLPLSIVVLPPWHVGAVS